MPQVLKLFCYIVLWKLQIKAAVELLRDRIDNLPKPRTDSSPAPEVMDGPVFNDLFDWLWQTFGFQVKTQLISNFVL